MKEEWTTKVTLRTHIDHAMDQMAGNSLLVVCIMSHGTAGVLRDSGGAAMPITDILSNMRIGLPESLPLVRTPVLFEKMLLI